MGYRTAELQPRDVKYAFGLPTWGNATLIAKPGGSGRRSLRRGRRSSIPPDISAPDALEIQARSVPRSQTAGASGARGVRPPATCPNYHGEASPTLDNSTADTDDEEEEEWMAVEDLRAGMRVRFVVQSFGTYKEHSWANISRVLVERQEEEGRGPAVRYLDPLLRIDFMYERNIITYTTRSRT